MKNNTTKGFTLIEVLLVIAILAILAAIVIIAINPAKQLGEAHDAQRRSDVRAILDAVHQYSIDNSGLYPANIAYGNSCINEGLEVCQPEIGCIGGSNLDELVQDAKYLIDLPSDPSASTEEVTGYKILINSAGRVEVCAPNTYGSEQIVVTR